MHNELTQKDIQMMKDELDYRRIQLRPKLLEAVKEARGFGDLSENFEYKAAKQEKNRNESRIRFLLKFMNSLKRIKIRKMENKPHSIKETETEFRIL